MVDPLLPRLADFLTAQTGWIIDKWTKAVDRRQDIESSETLTYRQLVDHLPLLLVDLAERLRSGGEQRSQEEIKHADEHGHCRWEQDYELAEVIQEMALVRQIVVDCVDAFARESPDFDAALLRTTGTILHQFFTKALVQSARQFTADKESALNASEQNRQAILDSALDCIIVMDEGGSVREWNPAAESLFGYKRAETLGKELATLIIPPELRARHRAGLSHYLATEEGPVLGKRIEVPAIRADGSRLLVELAITPHRTDGKAVFTAYLRDISERVETERRRSAQYAIATLLSGDASLPQTGGEILKTIAASGRWVFGALWACGQDRKLVCQSAWRADGSLQTQLEADTTGRVFSEGEGLPARVIASGKPIWIADVAGEKSFPRREAAQASGIKGAFLFPLYATSGVNGVIELFSDAVVSPDADLLELVGALGSQIGLYIERLHTEEELRRQKETAEAASLAKDRFLATLSHELRTPLNPVLMWACATSETENIDPALKEGLKMVCRNIEMEARLIDDLLDLTRIARGKLHLSLQPCKADELLRHALDIVRSQLTGKQLQVALELAASNHQIIADPTRIEQVFWNLLKNAQKFTPENGKIVVRSFDVAPDILGIEITDTGPGIDAEVMPRLFTAFEQGGESREGLGLGLAICKAIVELHGGQITATNRVQGSGATFRVEWKTAPEQSDLPAQTPRQSISIRSLRILIVEDHGHTAAVMKSLLLNEGHTVFAAGTVREALDIIRTTPLDLLVSDLGLPDGNGFQIMQELSKTSDAKGIAVSGYGMEEDIERSSGVGFSAHLTKPINVQELREAIQKTTT